MILNIFNSVKKYFEISNEFIEVNCLKFPPSTYIFSTNCKNIFPFNEDQYCVYWEKNMFIQNLKQFCSKRFQVNTHIDQVQKAKNVNPIAKLRNTNTNNKD